MNRVQMTRETVPGLIETMVLRIRGELDHYTFPAVKNEVNSLLESEYRAIVIDFSEITFLDSTSITFFISLQRKQRSRFEMLMYAAPSVFVQRAVASAYSEKLIFFHNHVAAAIEAMEKSLQNKK